MRSVLEPDVVMAGVCAAVLADVETAAAPEFAISGKAELIVKSSHKRSRASKTREPECSSPAPIRAARALLPTPADASLRTGQWRRCKSRREATTSAASSRDSNTDFRKR